MGRVTERPCTALVVGTDDWARNQAAGALQAAGITVLTCHESGAPAFPCNAFIDGRVCPIDEGFDVVLTARARPSRVTEPGEIGVVCALRTGRPLVVAGVTAENPFTRVATKVVDEGSDAAQACREAVGIAADEQERTAQLVVDLRAARR
jgi:hypothetical protein